MCAPIIEQQSNVRTMELTVKCHQQFNEFPLKQYRADNDVIIVKLVTVQSEPCYIRLPLSLALYISPLSHSPYLS